MVVCVAVVMCDGSCDRNVCCDENSFDSCDGGGDVVFILFVVVVVKK